MNNFFLSIVSFCITLGIILFCLGRQPNVVKGSPWSIDEINMIEDVVLDKDSLINECSYYISNEFNTFAFLERFVNELYRNFKGTASCF